LSSWRESIVDLLDHLRLDGPDELVDLLHALTSSTEITSLKASPRSCSQPNIRENLVSSSQYNAEAKGMATRAPAPAVAPWRNGSNTSLKAAKYLSPCPDRTNRRDSSACTPPGHLPSKIPSNTSRARAHGSQIGAKSSHPNQGEQERVLTALTPAPELVPLSWQPAARLDALTSSTEALTEGLMKGSTGIAPRRNDPSICSATPRSAP
jgi:hypothetical protein